VRSSFRLEPTFPLRHWPVVGLLSAVFSVGRCAVPLRRPGARGGWNIRGFCGTIRQGEPLRRCALTAKGRRGAPSDSPLPTGLGHKLLGCDPNFEDPVKNGSGGRVVW